MQRLSAALPAFLVFATTSYAALASGDDPRPAVARPPLHATYLRPDDIRLERVLPPPPAPDSTAGRADLAAVQAAVQRRMPADETRIAAMHPCTALAFASDIMGPGFTAPRVPKTLALVGRAFEDAELAVLAAKKVIGRARPYRLDPGLATLGRRSESASYPSGHATCGRVMAVILANIVPEKADALYARADLYGRNRLQAGTHFPSDLVAGATAGSVIADALFRNARFAADFAQAKAETKAALR